MEGRGRLNLGLVPKTMVRQRCQGFFLGGFLFLAQGFILYSVSSFFLIFFIYFSFPLTFLYPSTIGWLTHMLLDGSQHTHFQIKITRILSSVFLCIRVPFSFFFFIFFYFFLLISFLLLPSSNSHFSQLKTILFSLFQNLVGCIQSICTQVSNIICSIPHSQLYNDHIYKT